jgi:AcrR family transcriptional regulator
MSGTAPASTRDIAREAIRAELARLALDLFLRDGFDSVTVNDLAAAGGVSRSTFLRYFASKEEAVLGVVDAQAELVAGTLAARPADEDAWTALRHALVDTNLDPYRQDRNRALAMTRLIMHTPALSARLLEKQNSWRPTLAKALAERRKAKATPSLRDAALAAAALACLDVALRSWSASDGRRSLVELVDETFDTLTTSMHSRDDA